MNKTEILGFIKTKIHAVVSTVNEHGQPQAALVGFGETDDFQIIMGTSKNSRKYRNLQKNSKVGMVIGWDEEYITVQIDGTARELEKAEWDKYLETYHAKVPSAIHYSKKPDQTYFLITPSWVRYSDLSGEEELITEINL